MARFNPGDKVIVRATRQRAVIQTVEPYRTREGVAPGYYVSYPDATEQWHCHSGWKAEYMLDPDTDTDKQGGGR